MKSLGLTLIPVLALTLSVTAGAKDKSPTVYEKAAAIKESGPWTMIRSEGISEAHARYIQFKNSAGRIVALRLPRRHEEVDRLQEGDTVIFTLEKTVAVGRKMVLPAVEIGERFKMPRGLIFTEGSYLIPHIIERSGKK